MRRSAIAPVAALALALSACGADDAGRSPITTVQNTTVRTDESQQTDEDADKRKRDDEGNGKAKDRGKGHAKGKGGDSD
jgi:hypothetical protein